MIDTVMPTYGVRDIAFDRGEGIYLIDTAGRRFLDCGSGIAVTSVGHAHPHLVQALKAQAEMLNAALPVENSDRNEYLVRNILAVDPDRGLIVLGDVIAYFSFEALAIAGSLSRNFGAGVHMCHLLWLGQGGWGLYCLLG